MKQPEIILDLELVPSSCFYKNLRRILTKTQWIILSKQICSQVYNVCEICQSTSDFLDCHEIWEYDDINKFQILKKLQAICKNCHGVKHFGFSQLNGKYNQTLQHFIKINKLTKKEAEKYIKNCFDIWLERSKYDWILDTSALKRYGVNLDK